MSDRPASPDAAPPRGRLLVISGPSGVGKSTIRQRVVERSGAEYSVSATTRAPRAGEVDGRDYRFVTVEAFRRMIERDELLEWAEVFGNYYGTPAGPVREAIAAGRDAVLEIDVQGGLQVAKRCPEAVFVLIVPPDEQTLSRRLNGRATDSPEVIARRLAKAHEEINTARRSGVYTHEVVNDDLDHAVERVLAILRQEKTTA